jgi:tetratricopeptide (TPR) repeat protein
MSESPNKLIKFWQELKRRKTGKVIIAYAATAFILLQLADILTPALLLPEWTTRLVTLILIIGFPIAVIFSWVFEITPEGIKKTESFEESEKKVTPTKPVKRKLKPSYVINAILIMAVIVLAYPKIFKRNTLEKMRSSGEKITVAVMPFQNMTNDTIWNVWQDGIQNELITSLTNSEELKVRQPESINTLIQSKGLTNYASITPSVASTISQKLDANIFIYGSIKQVGTTIRINAQLIDSKTEETFKSFQIDGIAENILHITDSLAVMVKNYLIISELKKEESLHIQQLASTNSPEAYRYFIYGQNAYMNTDFATAVNMYSQAIAIDSNFTSATIRLSFAYGNQNLYDQAKKWCLKVYEKRDQMPMRQKIYTDFAYAIFFETPYEEIKYLKQLQEIDDQLPYIYFNLGSNYIELYQYDKAIPELEKAWEISKKWHSKSQWVYKYTLLGFAYHKTAQYKKEKRLYKKAEQQFPDDPDIISFQVILSITEGDTIAVNRYIEKYISIGENNSWSEALIKTGLASIYYEAGSLDKAEVYYRQALLLEPENPDRLFDLAWFLIDKDRNINEGLQLVNTALKLRPDNYNYLHTKGWGLYKQGKYQEALDILQKSWDLRMKNAVYYHEAYLHLEAAKKAVAGLKNN